MKTNSILVTGDFVIDHHLLKGNKSEASGTENTGTFTCATYGGAKLTFDLLQKFVDFIDLNTGKEGAGPGTACSWPFREMPATDSSRGTSHDSYLQWTVAQKDKKGIRELSCKPADKLGFGNQNEEEEGRWFQTDNQLLFNKYDTIVIDEACLGFRNQRDAWPDFESAGRILLKTTVPLCEGLLWNKLLKYRKKLITIVRLNQIKQYGIKVSNDISWEQTALDIVYGLNNDLTLKNLLKSGEIIVTIGSAGAVYIKTGDDMAGNEYTLVFDPEYMENEWEEKFARELQNSIGAGASFMSGFVASHIAKGLNIVDSIKIGLNAMTFSLVKGVFKLKNDFTFEPVDLSNALTERCFGRYYSSAYIPSPAWQSGFVYLHNQEWSILENNYDNHGDGYRQKTDLYPLSFSLAEFGKSNLHYAPRQTLGKVTLFDRNEIENVKNIRKQVDFFDRYDDGKKPLNIAVFGPPGAGKSFIVKALANAMFEGRTTRPSFLTFNLSQFRDETELSGAFHTIRDEVLRGKLPIVFWDEFDSDDYKWLKSLIAPMQDGEFQEGKEVHPIGKCIFVFAGGMTYTMRHFCDKMDGEEYIVKKGPDFQSRINCSLDVFGPNRKPCQDSGTQKWMREGEEKDICFSVRRALFIRSILGSDDRTLNIDKQLLRVLIEVSSYKNGSRGLERLLRNLAVHSDRKIEQSDLPSKEIIQMNVDYLDFMQKLSDEATSDKIAFEQIAASIHNAWLHKNVTYSVFFKKYEDLSYDQRMDNISAAMRMEEVIAGTGRFRLISEADLKSGMLPDAGKEFLECLNDESLLDKLSELEHNGWMQARKNANWVPGKRSDYHKTHDCMIPFSELDEGIAVRKDQVQKNKDRDSVKGYVSMLEGSGYTITFKQ
jgi:hypothetical protein